MLDAFYRSKEWTNFRKIIINERGSKCQKCGKEIVAKGDLILHHTPIELTETNYEDVNISLNPENVQIVCASCHNIIHNKRGVAGKGNKNVYVVFGAPCSGKTTYVMDHADRNALILDVDKLYNAMSINALYDKSDRLTENVMQVRTFILDMIRTRKGQWSDAYIITASCNPVELGRFKREYRAELIHMDVDMNTCIKRAYERNTPHFEAYIKQYFDMFEKYNKIIIDTCKK